VKAGKPYKAIVIGTSAGGLFALSTLLSALPTAFPLPVLVVQHRSRDQRDLLEELLQTKCRVRIKQADEKEPVQGGTVYVAPPDYHLLVEADETLSLSCDDRVLYSRPSIDVLFESAALVYGDRLVAVILTGANEDGASGIRLVKKYSGLTIAQDPAEAQFPYMPKASIDTKKIDRVWRLAEIGDFLATLNDVCK
jgi:two-component system, chemotaxis family, protein-glutamate methylesterase/glutaminase